MALHRQLQRKPPHHSSEACHTNLLGKVVQQGVEAFEAALVDRHPDAPELVVTAFVEGDPLGRRGCGHVCEARGGVGRVGEGRGIFRWGPGVPRLCLDRLHAAISHTPEGHGVTEMVPLFSTTVTKTVFQIQMYIFVFSSKSHKWASR